MSNGDLTTIPLKKDTRTRLRSYGNKGETWDVLTNKVLNELDVSRKEKEILSEIRSIIFCPIDHIMESSEEDFEQLELTEEFHKAFDGALKRFWKRFVGMKFEEKEI